MNPSTSGLDMFRLPRYCSDVILKVSFLNRPDNVRVSLFQCVIARALFQPCLAIPYRGEWYNASTAVLSTQQNRFDNRTPGYFLFDKFQFFYLTTQCSFSND